MKLLVIISILLISCIACGCISSDDGPAIEEKDEIKNDVMTCYDKDIISAGSGNVRYVVVLVDSSGNAYQDSRAEDPSIYASIEIGSTYELEISRIYNHDITVSKIVEYDQVGY